MVKGGIPVSPERDFQERGPQGKERYYQKEN